jgi:hypothetical protein
MQDVSVQQQEPSLCVQQGGNIPGVMAVSTEAQLLAALTEADISTMLVTANITLQRSSWQVTAVAFVPPAAAAVARHTACTACLHLSRDAAHMP